MRISDWSSDVCSSDLPTGDPRSIRRPAKRWQGHGGGQELAHGQALSGMIGRATLRRQPRGAHRPHRRSRAPYARPPEFEACRSEEHTSELQSLMRISYAVFCLKKKNKKPQINHTKQINIEYTKQTSNNTHNKQNQP